jgi:hypothetical protein
MSLMLDTQGKPHHYIKVAFAELTESEAVDLV